MKKTRVRDQFLKNKTDENKSTHINQRNYYAFKKKKHDIIVNLMKKMLLITRRP